LSFLSVLTALQMYKKWAQC